MFCFNVVTMGLCYRNRLAVAYTLTQNKTRSVLIGIAWRYL